MTSEITELLIKRRSTAKLTEPAPTKSDVEKILQVAMTVPDHGSLKPYRFIVIEGEKRKLFADAMVATASEQKGELTESAVKKIEAKAFLAPMQIAIIFNPKLDCKIPEWEQFATASCTGYAITLAASGLGFESIWKSFGPGAGKPIKELFNMTATEQLLGWINLGSKCPNPLPPRPTPNALGHFKYLE